MVPRTPRSRGRTRRFRIWTGRTRHVCRGSSAALGARISLGAPDYRYFGICSRFNGCAFHSDEGSAKAEGPVYRLAVLQGPAIRPPFCFLLYRGLWLFCPLFLHSPVCDIKRNDCGAGGALCVTFERRKCGRPNRSGCHRGQVPRAFQFLR